MNTKGIKLIVLVAMLFATSSLMAQDEFDLTEVANHARERVGQLNDYIEFMASKKVRQDDKPYYKNAALKLFIYEGKPYTKIIELKDGSRKPFRDSVTIEISSVRYDGKERRNMRAIGKYFDGLINFNYASVSIETTDIKDMTVGEIYKTGEGQYVCSVYFDQKFIGRTKEGRIYSDITRKYVVCHIDMKLDAVDGTYEPYVRLGDIYVGSTTRLQ